MLNVVMLNVANNPLMVSVVMLNVVILNVVAPNQRLQFNRLVPTNWRLADKKNHFSRCEFLAGRLLDEKHLTERRLVDKTQLR
jgi:hypothetical protein